MMTLALLGPEGFHRELQKQQQADAIGLAGESTTTDKPGTAGKIRGGTALSRKANAKARIDVEDQRHVPLIRAHILRQYATNEVREEIINHVDTLKNVQRRVTDIVAIAYNRPAARSLRGAEKGQEEAFRKAYEHALTDQKAEQWNRYAFFLAVVHVIPRFQNGKLRWVTVLPDTADVLFDDDDPDEPAILVFATKSHGAAYCAVDSERWWWVDANWKVVQEEEHHIGMRPWVPWRWKAPPASDYWDRGAGQDLFDGTLELGRVYAHTRWIRKNWSKKLTTYHRGADVSLPANQNLGANQPVSSHGDGQSILEVHDTIVGMTEFREEMAEIVASLAEAYGLEPADVESSRDNASSSADGKVNSHDRLAKLRDKQVKHFEWSERELAVRAVALLRHHGVLSMSEDEVRTSFRCRHAAMSFADHPKSRVETLQAQMEVAHRNPYDEYMLENPGVTEQEAFEECDRNVKLRARLYRKFVEENIPMNPRDDLKTAAQLNGQLGGRQSGEARNEKKDEDEDDVVTD